MADWNENNSHDKHILQLQNIRLYPRAIVNVTESSPPTHMQLETIFRNVDNNTEDFRLKYSNFLCSTQSTDLHPTSPLF